MEGIEESLEKEGLEHLARIEDELEAIKDRTPTPKRAFINGILQGAGALVGGIAGLIILGWALSVFGLIPGLGYITSQLQDATSHFRDR
jgi:hypothetical protein